MADHRKFLEALDPIVFNDNKGRIYRLSDVLRELGDWDKATEMTEVARLDDVGRTALGSLVNPDQLRRSSDPGRPFTAEDLTIPTAHERRDTDGG